MKKIQAGCLFIKKLVEKYQFVLYLGIFFLAFYALLIVQSHPTFLDPDSFYHIKITKMVGQSGPILDFPWLQFTVLKNYYVDHHLLYHVLGIPFIKIFGDFFGFKLYTVLLATLFILGSYWFFKKNKITYPEIFTAVLLLAPPLLFRISLAKASAFSLIILFAGIYCLIKKRYYLLIILSWLYVWSYGGFLLILLIAGFYILAETIFQTFINFNFWHKIKEWYWPLGFRQHFFSFWANLVAIENIKRLVAPLIGTILGLVLNPYFPRNLSFYWQQVFEIGIKNYRGAVNVGGEWYPYQLVKLVGDSGIVMVLAIISCILFFIFIKKQKTPSIFFFISALFFFVLTLKSQRYVEYFIPFAVYFSAFSCTYALSGMSLKKFFHDLQNNYRLIGLLISFLSLYIMIVFPLIMLKDLYTVYQQYRGGFSIEQFKGIGAYLEKNSQAGDIVMQTDWDDFPLLFYHNTHNYYIVGLDPTFMYNYDPQLYNLFADITTAKKQDNLSADVRDNFSAKYFIVDADRKRLRENLQNDGNFIMVYEDGDGSVWKVGE